MKKALWAVFGIVIFSAVVGGLNSTSKPEVQGTNTQAVEEQATPTDFPTNTLAPTPTDIPIATPTDFPTPTQAVYTAPVQQCAGATAICSDGSCSYSAHRQGTCSHHGGVAEWL